MILVYTSIFLLFLSIFALSMGAIFRSEKFYRPFLEKYFRYFTSMDIPEIAYENAIKQGHVASYLLFFLGIMILFTAYFIYTLSLK